MSSYHDAAPSLQEIESKLEKAEKARKIEMEKRRPKIEESFAKINQNREALILKEKETQQHYKESLDTKLEKSEKLRCKAIGTKVEKARRNSTKIDQAMKVTQEKQ